LVDDGSDVGAKRIEHGSISFAAGSNGDVDSSRRSHYRQQLNARKLAEAALEPVSIHCRVLMTRNHDPDARNAERGSEDPDIEMNGPNSLPLSNDGLNIRTPRQPMPARKVEAVVRRPRTCLAV
jgi:hypothetical protein